MSNLGAILLQKLPMFIAILIVAVIVAWVLSKFLDTWVRRAASRSKSGLDDTLLDALKRPLVYFVLVVGLWAALQQADFIIEPGSPAINTIFFILYMIVGYMAAFRLITGLIDWYGSEIAHLTETTFDDHILPFFRRVALIILTLIALVALLGFFNVNVSALVTTLGVGSLAIALAAQEVLSNMISGFIIMVDQPFRIGDRIELEELNTWGDVQDIGLHRTRILTRDNRLVSVPNALIGKNRIINHSIPSTRYRVQTHVSVAYGTDVDRVRQIIIEAIRAENWVMKDKKIEALFLEFRDSGIWFRVRCWIKHYVETRRVIDKMNTAIYKALYEAGIEIPFPQRVLHINNNGVSQEEVPGGR